MKLNKLQKQGIKQLAERLPDSFELQNKKYVVKGAEFDIDLRREHGLNDHELYVMKKNSLIPINHSNRLENAYKKNKEQGMVDYIYWLNNNNRKLNEIFKTLEYKQVSTDVMDIVKDGAKGFWKNLMEFLFAFLKVFGNKENN